MNCNFSKMARKGLKQEEIAILLEELPSDYETNTDDEEEEDTSPVSPLDLIQQENGEVERAIIIIGTSPEEEPSGDSTLKPTLGVEGTPNRRKWRRRDEGASDINFQPNLLDFSKSSTPLQFFKKFLDDNLIEIIFYQSNLLSVQKNKPASITKDEIKVFLGINMLMRIHSLLSNEHYWCDSDDLAVRPIKNAMSRERFQTILSNLHLADNTKIDSTKKDKLYKIKALIQ